MNNRDFAKLLVANKGGGGDEDGGGGGGGGVATKGGKVDRASLLKAISQQHRVKKQQARDDDDYFDDDDDDGMTSKKDKYSRMREEEESAAKEEQSKKKDKDGIYRDRAEERRKGLNPDYDDELAKLVEMDAEKTKYLGGDLKHTHLVKGLDFALLTKVRTELADAAQEAAKKREAEGGEEGIRADKDRKKRSMEAVSTRSLAGQGLKFVLLQTYSTEIKPIDIFRSSALEYTLTPPQDDDDDAEVLPTLISRSKVEMELEEEESGPLHIYTLPDQLQARITKAVVNYRQTAAGLKKRLKKRQRSEREYGTERPSDKPHAGTQSSKPHAHAPKPLVEDEDIFADVGKYVPPETTSQDNKPSKAAVGKDYFSGLRATRDDDKEDKAKQDKLDAMLQAINAKVGLGGEKHARDEAPAEEEEEQGAGGGGNRRERRKKQKGAAVQKSTVAGGLDLFGGGGEGGRGGAPKGVGFGKGGNEYDEYFPDAGFAGYDSDEERGRVGTNRTKEEKAADAARARKERAKEGGGRT